MPEITPREIQVSDRERDEQHGPAFHSKGNLDGTRRSRRTFSELDPHAKGEIDHLQRAIQLRAIFVTLLGLGVGGAGGIRIVESSDLPVWMIAVFSLGAAAISLGGYLAIIMGSGRVAQQVYAPSGSTTPRKAEYSYAESLAVRGDYADAITAFELCVVENPADPGPYVRIARIYRDELEDFPSAERWFKRLRNEAQVDHGMDVLARRELIELYRGKMDAPTRAAPVLARMAEEYEGSPEGAWAATELAEVKALIAGQGEQD